MVTAYHGTNALFDTFDPAHIGDHGDEHGLGYYFTNNMQMAAAYGDHIVVARLDLKNSYSTNSITITMEQLKQLLHKVDPAGEDYLSNYGDVACGYSQLINHAADNLMKYNTSDIDILSDIFYFIKNNKNLNELFKYANQLFGKNYTIYYSKDFDDNNVKNFILFNIEDISIKEVKKWINKDS